MGFMRKKPFSSESKKKLFFSKYFFRNLVIIILAVVAIPSVGWYLFLARPEGAGSAGPEVEA